MDNDPRNMIIGGLIAILLLITGLIWVRHTPHTPPSDCVKPPVFKQIAGTASSSSTLLFGLDEKGVVWVKKNNQCWTEL